MGAPRDIYHMDFKTMFKLLTIALDHSNFEGRMDVRGLALPNSFSSVFFG